jgi:hypothetical protein
MNKPSDDTIFSNDDAEIIVVDESVGVTDRTRRPATGFVRKALEEQLAREAEFRKLIDSQNKELETKTKDGNEGVK